MEVRFTRATQMSKPLQFAIALLGLVPVCSSAQAASVFLKLDGTINHYLTKDFSTPLGRLASTGYSDTFQTTHLAARDTPFTAYVRYDTSTLTSQFIHGSYSAPIGVEANVTSLDFRSMRPSPPPGILDAHPGGQYSSYSLNHVGNTTYLNAQTGWRSSALSGTTLASFDIPESPKSGEFKSVAAAVGAKFPDARNSTGFDSRLTQLGLNGPGAMSFFTSGTGGLTGPGQVGFLNITSMSNFGVPWSYASDAGVSMASPVFVGKEYSFSGFVNNAVITEDPSKIISVSFRFEQIQSNGFPQLGIPITSNNLGVISDRLQLIAIPVGMSALGPRILTWQEAAEFYGVNNFNWTQRVVSFTANKLDNSNEYGFSRGAVHDEIACQAVAAVNFELGIVDKG